VIIDEGTVDLAGDKPLETADDVLFTQALSRASTDVIERGLMSAHADGDDPVERRVRLSVAAAEEPVAMGHSTRRGDRTGAAALRKCGFRASADLIVAAQPVNDACRSTLRRRSSCTRIDSGRAAATLAHPVCGTRSRNTATPPRYSLMP
jgi:hypothetical protein